ncbi:hypothetical protein AURDEDRAFT_68980 [Auricularia subglabra TFB-10046 SS5]|nr:hypothetical protein AURDEDRAFT_68980 [Auricularia subglabra TFB-10046 SS5]
MSAAFNETLRYITGVKLQELERQRASCRAYVDSALQAAGLAPRQLDRVNLLLQRIQGWEGIGALISDDLSLSNYELWAHQAELDPSVPTALIKTWGDALEKQLRQAVTRYDHVRLFGDLLEEWLLSGDASARTTLAPAIGNENAVGPAAHVRQGITHQQGQLEELIFTPKTVDTDALSSFLGRLFAGDDGSHALSLLRRRVAEAGDEIRTLRVTPRDLRKLMQSLLARDLLGAEKTATLKEFLRDDIVIQEIASVLSMQVAALDNWDWPEDGVRVDIRRHLNGKYRAYMDCEIIQALLLHHIGIQWSIRLKSIFNQVDASRTWKRGDLSSSSANATSWGLSQAEQRRRDLLEELHASGQQYTPTADIGWIGTTIEAQRRYVRTEKFFLSQLPRTLADGHTYDQDGQPESAYSESDSVMHPQQVLLRLISTETALQQALHGQCTVVRSDLEWFGPSISHDAILTSLRFYGMDERWLGFFGKWLQARLRFDETARTRRRGVPVSQMISSLCGEVLLFGMDLAVNQLASDIYVYRIYDDIWFVHHSPTVCASAWEAINTYTALCGLTLNANKTGAVCVGSSLDPALPRGPVGWGLIRLDADLGRFVVDQKGVDSHIAELKRQLANTKSIFGFVNSLNKYLDWMGRNFGQPARCFGAAHADDVAATFSRVFREVFADSEGSVALHLQRMLEQRFRIKDIPAGWVFLPNEDGGLGVTNPLPSILSARRTLGSSPSEAFSTRHREELVEYEKKRTAWAERGDDEDVFPTWREFVSGRETISSAWGAIWSDLQSPPTSPDGLVQTGASAADPKWSYRTSLERSVVALYGDELVERFGSLQTVEPTLIPVGMLSTFRSSRIAWDS